MNFKKDDLYIIEKVLKTKNDKTYVKWRNYDSSFNSWVNLDNIKNIYEKTMSLIYSSNMKKGHVILSSKMTYICYI